MRVGRQKLSVTQIFKTVAVIAAIGTTCAVGSAVARDPIRFTSPQDAFTQGMAAYRVRHFEIAIPALNEAAKRDNLFAMFYLARIYGDNSRAYTDHGRAYALYSRIVDRFYRIDPNDFRRSPTVAKSITAMARYVHTGLREIDLPADKAYAVRLYRYAAQYYNEPEAQFQLAKLQLVGDGVRKDVRSALYWFSRLVKRGHPSAQAFLADLYWRGKHLPRDSKRALALITVARRNAPPHELIWIDDIYQDIFCGTTPGVRKDIQSRVAGWTDHFGSRVSARTKSTGLNWLSGPGRRCSDGSDVVVPARRDAPVEPSTDRTEARSAQRLDPDNSSLIMGLTGGTPQPSSSEPGHD